MTLAQAIAKSKDNFDAKAVERILKAEAKNPMAAVFLSKQDLEILQKAKQA